VSFNFKKRCLEIFAEIGPNGYQNVFNSTDDQHDENENDDFSCMNLLLETTLDEGEHSLNLNDLMIPEVCLGNAAAAVLDVSDNTKCRYCFIEFDTKQECIVHMVSDDRIHVIQ
jgi:hypothetical protein